MMPPPPRVKVIRGPRTPLKGRHVVLVEDIVDTGLTTCFLMGYLHRRRLLSLKLCTLLDKPERRQMPVDLTTWASQSLTASWRDTAWTVLSSTAI